MSEIMLDDKKKQSCRQEELKPGVFWADEENTQLLTPTNIVGYYMRMVKSFLSSTENFSKVEVKPAINKELNEDFGNPVVVVKRDTLAAENFGILGSKTGLSEYMPQAIPGFETNYPQANLNESQVYSDRLTMGIHLNVYGTTSAEVESIGNAIFPLLMATSYDALRYPFPFIQYVTPPTMSPVDIIEKHSEIYMLSLSWNITYLEEAVLLIKKNVLKYATIVVKEELEERVIYRFDN